MFESITNNVLAHQVGKRIAASVVTLIAVSMLFFLLIEILPGDFAEVSAGRITSFSAVDRQRAAYGLDQNIPTRYWRWFTQAVQGEFGDSWFTGEPIGPMLWKRLGHTLWLALLSAVVSLPLGFSLGVISAIYAGRTFDRATSFSVLALTSVPEFIVAYGLMYVLAVNLSLFPVHTFFSDELGFAGRVHATILPALSLAGISIAPILRLTRATVLNVFDAPFMQMAELKGLTVWRITWRHAIPNVIAPVATMTVLVIANLVVGVVIVESIFSYPGFGQAMIMATQNRDIPLALACGLISGVLYLTLNLIADLVVLFSNPRLRHPSSGRAATAWILPPSVVVAWNRPATKYATAIVALLVTGLGYGYYQWSKSDGVTHSNINPPLWFRTALVPDDLLNDTDYYLEPVHFDNFLPVGKEAPLTQSLKGTIQVPTYQLLSRVSSRPTRWPGFVEAPGFEAKFITVGDRMVPANAGEMLATLHPEWRVIVDEGRLWSEAGDGEWSRAAFPLTLIHYDGRVSFSGAATFLYTHQRVSQLRVQFAQESAPHGEKYDYWGQTPISFTRHPLDEHATVESVHLARQATRLDVRPWSELGKRYGTSMVDGFEGEHGKIHISVSGLYVDDRVYLHGCRTRFGPYPFCRSYRHAVFSITKTLGAAIAMLHLSKTLGPEIFDARLLDYVPIDAQHDGWQEVTFRDLLNMSSGIGDVTPEVVDKYVDVNEAESSRIFYSRPSTEKKLKVIATLRNYPWGPDEVFRYQDTHTFLLSLAMRRYLRERAGPQADVWETLQREVFGPLAIGHLDVLRSREPDGELGVPLLESGIFPTFEQTLILARLLQNTGRAGDKQLLHRALTEQATSSDLERGLPTGFRYSFGGEDNYAMGLWLTPYRHYETCPGRIPFMVGFGGNYVGLMPNNMIAFRFADGWKDEPGTWDSTGLQDVANAIRPFCPGE